jgi:hypothetical protein
MRPASNKRPIPSGQSPGNKENKRASSCPPRGFKKSEPLDLINDELDFIAAFRAADARDAACINELLDAASSPTGEFTVTDSVSPASELTCSRPVTALNELDGEWADGEYPNLALVRESLNSAALELREKVKRDSEVGDLCCKYYTETIKTLNQHVCLRQDVIAVEQGVASLGREFRRVSGEVSGRLTDLEEQFARMKNEIADKLRAMESSVVENFTDEIQAMESRLDRRSIERFEWMKQLFKETCEEMDERFTKKSQEMNDQVTERLEEMGRRFTDGIKEMTALVQGQQEHKEKLASEDATAHKEGHEILRHVSAVLLHTERGIPIVERLPQHSTE